MVYTEKVNNKIKNYESLRGGKKHLNENAKILQSAHRPLHLPTASTSTKYVLLRNAVHVIYVSYSQCQSSDIIMFPERPLRGMSMKRCRVEQRRTRLMCLSAIPRARKYTQIAGCPLVAR